MPNFIEIGQTSLEIGGCQLGLGQKKLFCHRQKRDYLSRASQSARGATKQISTALGDLRQQCPRRWTTNYHTFNGRC